MVVACGCQVFPGQRFDVPGDPTAIGEKVGWLLGNATAGQQTPVFGVLDILVAQVGNGGGVPLLFLFSGGVDALGHVDQQFPRPIPRRVRRSGCAMPPDGKAPQPSVAGAEHKDVDNRLAPLATRSEACNASIPNLFARPKGAHLAQPNSRSLARHRTIRICYLAAAR